MGERSGDLAGITHSAALEPTVYHMELIFMPTKPSWEKNKTAVSSASTATSESSSWMTIRAVSSATDAQKLKHIRIAYSLDHSAGAVKGLIELMKWPDALTPSTSEPAAQDRQIFVQRPLVGDIRSLHFGFLRWPSVIVYPGEKLYLGFRILSAAAGTTNFESSITWLETVV